MKYFFLDTNIVLALIRSRSRASVMEQIGYYEPDRQFVISIVTIGELEGLALANDWGETKRGQLKSFLDRATIISLEYENIIAQYAEIYAFSQGRHPGRVLGDSARNMGQNDLWIAATTGALDIPIITTDGDFDHLHDQFITVIAIDRKFLR